MFNYLNHKIIKCHITLIICYILISGNVFSQDIPNCILGECENGEGVISYSDGSTFKGMLKNRIPNGYGEMTSSLGKKIVGTWRDGKAEGKCTSTLRDGRSFEGIFENGMPNGFGIEIFPDGVRYEGNYQNGLFHGNGKLIDFYGTIFIIGKFETGLFPEEFRRPRIEYNEKLIKDMLQTIFPYHKNCAQIKFHHNISLLSNSPDILNEISIIDICGKSIAHYFQLNKIENGYQIIFDTEKNKNIIIKNNNLETNQK
ncbi:MAG: hypothetical protein SH817_00820 [Leptospira sp.]|nr:hypothetical protein [Leptospira sp.]